MSFPGVFQIMISEYILSSVHTKTAWSPLKIYASMCLFKVINTGEQTVKLSLYETCCTVSCLYAVSKKGSVVNVIYSERC